MRDAATAPVVRRVKCGHCAPPAQRNVRIVGVGRDGRIPTPRTLADPPAGALLTGAFTIGAFAVVAASGPVRIEVALMQAATLGLLSVMISRASRNEWELIQGSEELAERLALLAETVLSGAGITTPWPGSGGDEFPVLLPGTAAVAARALGERVRRAGGDATRSVPPAVAG